MNEIFIMTQLINHHFSFLKKYFMNIGASLVKQTVFNEYAHDLCLYVHAPLGYCMYVYCAVNNSYHTSC